MQIDRILTVIATGVAIAAAVAAIIANRRKPKVDDATVAQIKSSVTKDNLILNAYRDQRVLDLELWGEHMRPWASALDRRDEQMMGLIITAYERLNWPMPDIVPKSPMPKFPEPRPLPS